MSLRFADFIIIFSWVCLSFCTWLKETFGVGLVTGATSGVGRRVVGISRSKGVPVQALVCF